MQITAKAIIDSPAPWLCPHCKSELVQAVKNGYQVEGVYAPQEALLHASDIVVCHDCKNLFIVMHADFLKRRYKKRREYPKNIIVEVPGDILTERDRILAQFELTKKTFSALEAKRKAEVA